MKDMKDLKYILNINDILKILPHRFPFLLIDKILDYKKKKYIHTLKNITANDFFFFGHFPEKFIFPGVLIIESIAQSSSVLLFYYKNNVKKSKKTCCLAGVNNTTFIHPVYPGDQMIVEVFFKRKLLEVYFFYGVVLVNNIIVCKSTISLSFL
ncbi:3-hydroxyacyl-ACP dehydratase FabZ [Buchnera aphidicola]|uniref:3-hydroxyacyl-ACP dehydratase FabZ n=1 Tax=Buchnera aphidicola TaxID=9 RepID=UPI00107CEC4D|nr:3-hydroxyacyl-ACP dehydratase FabZ [Buchnera aphidicola]VFP79166.1 3-hydroxyacyl-[acyl-carrier-protein] dehydratase FabZ [Buchnera aphidicola (Cinara curtihirsuta)]